MTYRSEEEALRARVAQLEGQLHDASTTIARLRGETPAREASGVELRHSKVLGVPVAFAREEELPYVISEAGYETIAELLRSRLGMHVTQVGRTLQAPGAFSLSREGGRTRIRMSVDVSALAGGAVAGGLMSLILPGLPALGLLLDAHAAVHALWVLPSIALGSTLAMRQLARRRVTTRIAQAQGTFAAILDAAEAHAIRGPHVRVATAERRDEHDARDDARDAAETPARREPT